MESVWYAPRRIIFFLNMCQSRIRFKSTLSECRQNEEIIRANAKSLMTRDMASFWKGFKKDSKARVPLALMIDNCIGDKEICDI